MNKLWQEKAEVHQYEAELCPRLSQEQINITISICSNHVSFKANICLNGGRKKHFWIPDLNEVMKGCDRYCNLLFFGKRKAEATLDVHKKTSIQPSIKM